MRKNRFLRFILIFCLIICTVFVFAFYAGAVDIAAPAPNAVQPNAFTIEELNIAPNYAILEGQTLQMQIEEFEEYIWLSSVEWSSSKPDIISCTKNGEIKGLKEGKATITVKAKVGNASDSITVYCAKRLNNLRSSRIVIPIAWTCQTPSFFHIQMLHFNIVPDLPIIVTGKLNIKGIYGSYFYVEFERSEKQYKGFILQNWLPSNIASEEVFRQLSTYDLDVFVNLRKDDYKVTTKYKGTVKWTVSDTSIISFDSNTGEVIGKKPGIATISATVGSKTLVCTVHSIYQWPLEWTGAARQVTYVYKAKGNKYEETSTQLAIGDTFIVKGDMGGDSIWAYGASENGTWGYIPISHISTKNTISYYNNLNIGYPIKDTSIKYISSPYSKRSSDLHRGFDITGGGSYIYGKELVSPVNGTVAYTNIYCYNNNKNPSYGFCITIISDGGEKPETALKDNVTDNFFAITFMHMSEAPALREGDMVEVGDVVGKIGNTGNVSGSPGVNPAGTHLHFEINNMEALMDSTLRSDFTYNINPIYFYMDKDFDFYTGSSAYQTFGAYWYGPDKKTEE